MTFDQNNLSMPLLLPAAPQTREATETVWYEVTVAPERRAVFLSARNAKADVVGTLEVKMTGRYDSEITISEGRTRISAKITLVPDAGGIVRVSVQTTKGEATIRASGGAYESAVADQELQLDDQEQAVFRRWGLLADPLSTLGQAVMAGSVQRTWGCGACLLLLAGAALGAGLCAEGNPAACAGALSTGGVFVENCEGACA